MQNTRVTLFGTGHIYAASRGVFDVSRWSILSRMPQFGLGGAVDGDGLPGGPRQR